MERGVGVGVELYKKTGTASAAAAVPGERAAREDGVDTAAAKGNRA